MSLNDADILELNELCNAVIDGALSEPQHTRLAQWLSHSREARELYVRVTGLSASLYHYAGEMHSEAPDAIGAQARPKHRWWWRSFAFLAVAASVSLLIWVGRGNRAPVAPIAATNPA